MRNSLQSRSLRSWIVAAMALALAPIFVSAGVGFVILDRGVIAPVHDVAFRQRQQIAPVQNLRVLIWDSIVSVDEYVEDGSLGHVEVYRKIRTEIEAKFAGLLVAVNGMSPVQELVERARQSWTGADNTATRLMSGASLPHTPETVAASEQFHGSIMATSDRLEATYRQLAELIEQDHDEAVLSYERAMWVAGIAAGVSLLAVAGGVVMIGRILSTSVDRLVEGAARFAEGDRSHRIDVAVPPELKRVAEEFNYMIRRIDESEKALAELALVDSLTGVSNRRAFDAAFAETLSSYTRNNVPAAVLAIDLDHFKRINDTWGHPTGDQILRAAAKVMIKHLRPSDRVFRMGGEEFTILLPSASLGEAERLAERLRQALASAKVLCNNNEITFTGSIGVAALVHGADRDDILAAADSALYQAKAGGRNRVVVYENI